MKKNFHLTLMLLFLLNSKLFSQFSIGLVDCNNITLTALGETLQPNDFSYVLERMDMANVWVSKQKANDDSGYFSFPNLPQGIYRVKKISPNEIENKYMVSNSVEIHVCKNTKEIGTVKILTNPNPAHEFLNVSISGLPFETVKSIALLNSLGVPVETIETEGDTASFKVKNLPEGIYLIYVRVAGRLIAIERVIIS